MRVMEIVLSTVAAVALVGTAICILRAAREARNNRAALKRAERERDLARDAAAERANRIAGWLGERVREVIILKQELRGVVMDVDACDRIWAIKDGLNDLNDRVLTELSLNAPEWVDYYLTDPAWHNPEVQRSGEADRQYLDRVLDYTALQLRHIQEGLRPGKPSTAGDA